MSKIIKAFNCTVGLPLAVGERLAAPFPEAAPESHASFDPELAAMLLSEAKAEALAIVDEAEAQAASLTREAKAESETLLAAARDEAAHLAAQAYQEGFSRGEQAGREQAAAAAQADLDAAAAAREAARAEQAAFWAEVEPEIIRLVVAVAAKVIGGELATNEAAVRQLVRQGVAAAAGAERVTVKTHPALAAALPAASDGCAGGVAIAEDASLPAGGCQIESEHGVVDAGVDTQLANLAAVWERVTDRG